jgi:hypothetical protein
LGDGHARRLELEARLQGYRAVYAARPASVLHGHGEKVGGPVNPRGVEGDIKRWAEDTVTGFHVFGHLLLA